MSSWSVTVVTPPASEPVLVDEARDQARIDGTTDAALIFGYIMRARAMVENLTNRVLLNQTLELVRDAFPDASDEPIRLPRGKVSSVSSLKYYDDNGTLQTWASSNYQAELSGVPARIVPVYGIVWPTTRAGYLGAVQIRYVAGYGSTGGQVPPPIIQAINWLVGHFYENREAITAGAPMAEIPLGVRDLLAPYRIPEFG